MDKELKNMLEKFSNQQEQIKTMLSENKSMLQKMGELRQELETTKKQVSNLEDERKKDKEEFEALKAQVLKLQDEAKARTFDLKKIRIQEYRKKIMLHGINTKNEFANKDIPKEIISVIKGEHPKISRKREEGQEGSVRQKPIILEFSSSFQKDLARTKIIKAIIKNKETLGHISVTDFFGDMHQEMKNAKEEGIKMKSKGLIDQFRVLLREMGPTLLVKWQGETKYKSITASHAEELLNISENTETDAEMESGDDRGEKRQAESPQEGKSKKKVQGEGEGEENQW